MSSVFPAFGAAVALAAQEVRHGDARLAVPRGLLLPGALWAVIAPG